jgi:NAD+ synthase
MLDAKLEVEKICEFVRDYYKKNNLTGAVLGVSGGKDSAVVAALLCEALGPENVYGLSLPCHSKETDYEDAKLVADHFGFTLRKIDLTNAYDSFVGNIDNHEQYDNANQNLKPRLRMSAMYYFASMLSTNGKRYIVAGTSNKSELFVGYFTKGGDSTHDIDLIADFTVSEVIKLGEELGVPEKVLYKAPSDGLSGKTDEDKLGVTYQNIEDYIYGRELDPEVKEKVERLHENNQHKFNIPTYRR